MNTTSMPACCTASIVYGFGESALATGNLYRSYNPPAEDIDTYLSIVEDRLRADGDAMIIITTNNQQTVANEVLEARGYSSSPWMSKGKHPETRVCLWYLPLLPIEEQS